MLWYKGDRSVNKVSWLVHNVNAYMGSKANYTELTIMEVGRKLLGGVAGIARQKSNFRFR